MRPLHCARRFAAPALIALLLAGQWLTGGVQAAATVAALPPHLDSAGNAAYEEFHAASRHKAFVVAPGGAWAWKGNEASGAEAMRSALRDCEQTASQRCVPFAVDDDNVFDAARWPTLWAPYPTPAEALRAPIGTARGNRFFDLAFRDPDGRPTSIAALRGAVVVVHFWGSWCGPCQHEIPELQALAQQLDKRSGIKLVLLQVREPIAASQAWVRQQGFKLPLSDSGASQGRAGELMLTEHRVVKDRQLAAVFPTSYVLDKQGIVLFAHAGPVARWPEYLPFLRHAAAGSARP